MSEKSGPQKSGVVPLTVKEPSGVDRDREPVTFGVPFPEGALDTPEHIKLEDGQGTEIPCQARVLGRWLDGSVKWILLDFQTDVSARGEATFELSYGPEVTRAPVEQGIRIEETEEAIRVDTGALKFDVGVRTFALFQDVTLTEEGKDAVTYQGEQGLDLILRDAVGVSYYAADQGEGADPWIFHWGEHVFAERTPYAACVEEAGPLRTVIRCTGRHRSVTFTHASPWANKEEECFSYVLRIYAYAGKPFVRLFYTFLNDQEESRFGLREVRLSLPLLGKQYALGLEGGGTLEGEVEEEERIHLLQAGPTAWERHHGTDLPFGYAVTQGSNGKRETLTSGEQAPGWVDLSGGDLGITVGVRKFWQLHPKALRIGPEGLDVALWPSEAGAVVVGRGEAKTHEFFLGFHEDPGDTTEAEHLAQTVETPLLALASPSWYCGSGALGDLSPANPERFPRYERMFQEGLKSIFENREQLAEYGMRDFGDWSYSRYLNGWGNMEYDLPYTLLLQFARTGDRRYYDLAEEAAWHFADTDVMHDHVDPCFIGAPHGHASDHNASSNNTKPPSLVGVDNYEGGNDLGHTFLEGLVEYHFFSGHIRPMEAAREIGDFCVRAAARTVFKERQSRQMGWTLNSLMGIYRATGEERYMHGARPLLYQLLEWQDEEQGIWPHPINYCPHTPKCQGSKPFHVSMIVEGLRACHELTGMEELKGSILKAADWMVNVAWIKDKGQGRCISIVSGTDTMELDSLGYAYLLSEDRKYLELGLKCLHAALPSMDAPSALGGLGLAHRLRNASKFIHLIEKLGLWKEDGPAL